MNSSTTEPELEIPYWRLHVAADEHVGVRDLVRRLRMAIAPIFQILRKAAPRASLAIIVFQVLTGAATAWTLLLTARVLEALITTGPGTVHLREALPPLLVLGFALIVKFAMETGTSAIKARLTPQIHYLAEQQLIRASLQVELASFDDPKFYDQLHRARDRGVMHMESVTECIVDVLRAILGVAGASVALIWLQPILFPVLLLAVLPEAWSSFYVARLQYASMAKTITLMRQADMISDLAMRRESAPEIRANQAEAYLQSEYDHAAQKLRDHLAGVGLAQVKATAVGNTLAGAGLVATFVVLALLLRADWIPLAIAGTAIIAIRSAGSQLSQLVRSGNELFQKGLYIADYREFLQNAAQRRRPDTGMCAPSEVDVIELDHVGFSYPSAEGRKAICDASLRILPHQTIALVGENGSGKTTLAKLIAGLYEPSEGKITWGGININRIVPARRAELVGMVMQEPVRWPKNVRENVRLGRHTKRDPRDESLLDAAHLSRSAEFVEQLPHRWETLLSRYFKGGQDLSGGQWQRLAVARGLFRDAPLVIWDEPTAALDPKAEQAVYETLRKVAANRTMVLITHRLMSVRSADRIFFLDNGSIVEQGTHEELLSMNGRYAELFKLQAQFYASSR